MNKEVNSFLSEKVSNFLLTSVTVHNKIGSFHPD